MQPAGFSSINDLTWIRQAQQGDDEAFTRLVEVYQKPVYNLCYRMMGEPEAAEEAAQETFLRVYQNLIRYDGIRPFATWLLSIAAHHCIDRLRRQRFISFSLDENEGEDAWLPDRTAPDPEEETAKRLDEAHLHALLETLEPVQRSILVLHYWQGISEAEIAGILHLSAPAVRSRLHRARRVLARLWQVQPEAASVEMKRPVTTRIFLLASTQSVAGQSFGTPSALIKKEVKRKLP